MSFGVPFSEPFFSGGGVATEAGIAYPISLGGIAYGLDLTSEFVHSSVPLQRPAQDDKENAGRGTLNPESFWRRTFESWHVGAGQTHFDRVDDSIPWRFRRSKGVNVWDRYQISLLNATAGRLLTANTNVRLAVAGDYLYLTDGTAIKRTQDVTVGVPTYTTVTGTPGTAPTSIASDGFNILTAHGASGIYKTTRGAATTASHITGTVAHVAYGKGRWIATNGPTLYDITTLVAGAGPVALPAALFVHPNADFSWNCFAEGPSAFYVGGTSGDKSLIYRLTMREDGTGLNQPVVAGFLPDGETIHAMQGYLGFVLIGTSKGVRLGIVGGNGDLTIGALIATDDPVLCFEGQDKFVWFGWSSFEGSTSHGLGRINLETFSDPEALVPSYASDLMATSAAGVSVTSVVTFQDRLVFSVNGGGVGAVVIEDLDNLVDTGEIDSGLFDYGLTEEKLSLFVDMSHVSHDGGSHTVWLSLDRGSFVSLGTFEEEHHSIATGEARANEFEIRVTLNRNPSDTSMGPIIRSWALRSQPATDITEQIVVPLLIGPDISRTDGFSEITDSLAQADNIKALCKSKEIAVYQRGQVAQSVIVADYEMVIHGVYVAHDAQLGINATCNVRLKEIK